jgi:cobalt/nickel transport system permease protein
LRFRHTRANLNEIVNRTLSNEWFAGDHMHISDGVLSGSVSLACGAVAAAGCGLCVRRFRATATPADTPRMGLVASFIFAAQMVNFPLGFAPVSGHLMGGTLAACLLGPWGGGLAIAAVLLVQAVLMGDGALTALGANWLNMGLIGAVGSGFALEFLIRSIGRRLGVITAAMLAAWASVALSAAAFSLELAFSTGFANFSQIFVSMVLVHAVIGLGEAIITGLVLRGALWSNPELVPLELTGPALNRSSFAGAVVVTAAVVVFLAPLASSFPDGLEFVGGKYGFIAESTTSYEAPLPDYSTPGLADGRWSTVVAGLVGTLTVFIAGILFSRIKRTDAAGSGIVAQ